MALMTVRNSGWLSRANRAAAACTTASALSTPSSVSPAESRRRNSSSSVRTASTTGVCPCSLTSRSAAASTSVTDGKSRNGLATSPA